MSGASGPASASSSTGLVVEDAACRDCACRSRWVGYLEEIERVFAQTNATDKRHRLLAVQVEGLCAGTVAISNNHGTMENHMSQTRQERRFMTMSAA